MTRDAKGKIAMKRIDMNEYRDWINGRLSRTGMPKADLARRVELSRISVSRFLNNRGGMDIHNINNCIDALEAVAVGADKEHDNA